VILWNWLRSWLQKHKCLRTPENLAIALGLSPSLYTKRPGKNHVHLCSGKQTYGHSVLIMDPEVSFEPTSDLLGRYLLSLWKWAHQIQWICQFWEYHITKLQPVPATVYEYSRWHRDFVRNTPVCSCKDPELVFYSASAPAELQSHELENRHRVKQENFPFVSPKTPICLSSFLIATVSQSGSRSYSPLCSWSYTQLQLLQPFPEISPVDIEPWQETLQLILHKYEGLSDSTTTTIT
jgi:hypothetical protein